MVNGVKVLIVGGSGMIGRKLAERLARDGQLGRTGDVLVSDEEIGRRRAALQARDGYQVRESPTGTTRLSWPAQVVEHYARQLTAKPSLEQA
jgi:nucleoside-diphosphate-sugar epimerase